ncbi:MAG: polysaccharide deacetylase family protein [Planctomycetes bacterium]|nr:polysaccharide deacetylase family protein [Planctomycetota bacterium]
MNRTLRCLAAFAVAALLIVPTAPRRAETGPGSAPPGPGKLTLQERLGHAAADRLLILNSDDTGMCHAANVAALEGMTKGLITDATVMVPCPWFPEIAAAARKNPNLRFGVHLTLNAEWEHYRWRPVLPASQVPSLVDGEGYLWPDDRDVVRHVKVDDAVREWRAQLARARDFGIDVTHFDSHMGCYEYRQDLYVAALALAREMQLPLRVAFPLRVVPLKREGFPVPDSFFMKGGPNVEEARKVFFARFDALRPGVHEIGFHASVDSPELHAITHSGAWRAADFAIFMDPQTRAYLDQKGIKLISWRDLRDLMRKGG